MLKIFWKNYYNSNLNLFKLAVNLNEKGSEHFQYQKKILLAKNVYLKDEINVV